MGQGIGAGPDRLPPEGSRARRASRGKDRHPAGGGESETDVRRHAKPQRRGLGGAANSRVLGMASPTVSISHISP